MTHAESSPRVVRSVAPASMVDQVAKEIRRSILSGALRPGQRFSLREIAAQMEISFIPVREALCELEAQGLVVTRPGKSAYVTPLSREDLTGIYRLRRRLEPDIAARASLLLDKPAFDGLQRHIDMFANPALGIDEVYEAHHLFHVELLAPALTAWDLRILTGLWHAAERYVRLAFAGRDDDPSEHLRRSEAHVELLETFRRRQPDAVAAAIQEHLIDNEAVATGALEFQAPQ